MSNIRTPVKKKLHQRVLLFDENDPHTRGISNVWYPFGIIQQMTPMSNHYTILLFDLIADCTRNPTCNPLTHSDITCERYHSSSQVMHRNPETNVTVKKILEKQVWQTYLSTSSQTEVSP